MYGVGHTGGSVVWEGVGGREGLLSETDIVIKPVLEIRVAPSPPTINPYICGWDVIVFKRIQENKSKVSWAKITSTVAVLRLENQNQQQAPPPTPYFVDNLFEKIIFYSVKRPWMSNLGWIRGVGGGVSC